MKHLFVTWDGGGNLHCVLPLARRLSGRGDEVTVLGNRSQREAIERSGCSFVPYERAPDIDSSGPDGLLDDWRPRSLLATSGVYRDKLMFGPASLFAADLLAEVDRNPPDTVLVDYFLLGAVAAAESTGLPAASCWHTAYAPPTVDVPVFGLGWGLPRGLPGRLALRATRMVNRSWWSKSLPRLNATRAELDLPPLGSVFDQFDRLDRALVMTSPAFDFAGLNGASLPANVRFVGPQLDAPRGSAPGAPSESGQPPLVLVSFSTTYQAQDQLLQLAVDALGALPVRGLVTTGPAVSLPGPIPDNVEIRDWLDHSEVLPDAAVVLSHAGHGTVIKSLAHGVPVVCIPMGRDQPCVAARVVHAGAGVRLDRNPSEEQIANAVQQALHDPSLRRNADRLGTVFRQEIAADRGVAEMDALGRRGEAIAASRG